MAWKSPITVLENINWESPIDSEIKRITREINDKQEDAFVQVLKTDYGITVDKQELIKALSYSKEQYDKGYEDGKAEGYYEGYKACFEKICGNIEKIIE